MYTVGSVSGNLNLTVALARVNDCPQLGGINSDKNDLDDGVLCFYRLGTRLR